MTVGWPGMAEGAAMLLRSLIGVGDDGRRVGDDGAGLAA